MEPQVKEQQRADFLDGARAGRNGGWRWLAGILVVLFFWFGLGGIPAAVSLADGRQSPTEKYLTLNAGFVFFLLGLWVAARWVHRRRFGTLASPDGRLRLGLVGRGAAYWIVGTLVWAVLSTMVSETRYTYTLDPKRFFLLLPVVLVLTTVQATTEELFFRGYLLQGLALRTRNVAVLAVLNGVIFAVPHLSNPEVGSGFALLATYYFAFGAFLTLVAIRCGRLELVIGAHVANNLAGALLVRADEFALTTNTVFSTGALSPLENLVGAVFTFAVFWYLAFHLRRTRVDGFDTGMRGRPAAAAGPRAAAC